MLYLDTCVLLALLLPEPHSECATRFLEQASEQLLISPWCSTELHSALGFRVRTGSLSTGDAERVIQVYDRELVPALVMVQLESADFANADVCLRGWRTSLRAGDALHLAIAAGRGACLCSLDQAFVRAALQLKLEARLINT